MALLWVGVFPLWNGGSYASITRAKWMGMNWLAGATVLLCLLSAVLSWRGQKKPAPRKGIRDLSAALPWITGGLLLIWLGLSCRFGTWHEEMNERGQPIVLYGLYRHEGLFTSLTCAAVFICLALVRPGMRTLAWGAGAALDLSACLALLQYFNLNPLGLFPEGTDIFRNYEFQSFIGNIDFISEYLSLMVPLLFGAWLTERRSGFFLASALIGTEWLFCMEVQAGLLALAAMTGGLLLLTVHSAAFRGRGLAALAGISAMAALRRVIRLPWLDGGEVLRLEFSMAALILFVLTAALAAAAVLFIRKPGKNLPWRWILAVCLVLLLAAVPVFLGLSLTPADGGLWEMQQVLKGHPEDSFGSYRLGVWRHTWDLAMDSPAFGLGPGTFYRAHQAYLRAERITWPQSFDNPHNMALGMLADGGFPALILWLALMGILIVRGVKRGGWNAVTALSMSCYLTDGIFAFPVCAVSPIFWALAGLCCGMTQQGENL